MPECGTGERFPPRPYCKQSGLCIRHAEAGYIPAIITCSMSESLEKAQAAAAFIKSRTSRSFKTVLILGSGLGNFINEMTIETEIGYGDIPYFPVSTVEGHSGKLIAGAVGDKNILVFSGRFHFYEGYTAEEVTFPIRVMKLLGAEYLLLSNAAGGVNPAFRVGDLVMITDHISLATVNPLIGRNEPFFGTRFPDMSEPYAKILIEKARQIAQDMALPLKEGIYFGVTGPSFETRAEYQMIYRLGADMVGMSTVQETITGVHCGLKVFGISVITDIGIREEDNIITHEEVLLAANEAAPKMTALVKELVKAI